MAKTSSEQKKRELIAELLRAQVPNNKIATQLNVDPKTIYNVKKRLEGNGDLSRKQRTTPSHLKLTEPVLEDIRDSFAASPHTSINKMAKIKELSATTIKTALKKLDLKSKVRPKKFLLTTSLKEKRLGKSKKVVNWLKRPGNGKKVKVFSDEKNFYVDQAYNRRNDRCVVQKDSEAIPVMKTKHPQSVMVLGVVASDGKKMPPYFFPEGLKINTDVYYRVLRYTVLPWLKANYPEGNYVWQQDGAPAHNSAKCQKFCEENFAHFWDKSMWPPSSPDCNPLDYSV